jgi:hypothetical protein
LPADIIDHLTLSRLAAAGTVRAAHVVGRKDGWVLHVIDGKRQRTLAAAGHDEAEVFPRMEALVSYLRTIGIQRFDVDAAGFPANGVAVEASLEPVSANSDLVREAARHDVWFRNQVEAGLQEADDRGIEWIDHDAVKAQMASLRDSLAARLKGNAR